MPNGKPEFWEEWSAYRQAGGQLSYQGWLDAGKPPVAPKGLTQEEKAAAQKALEEAESLDQYWLALDQAQKAGLLTAEEVEERWQAGLLKYPAFKRVTPLEELLAKQDIERQRKAIEEKRLAKSAAFHRMPVETLRALEKAYGKGSAKLGEYLERREEAREERERKRRFYLRGLQPAPEPEYAQTLEAERQALIGPQTWKEWALGKYKAEISRWEAIQPEEYWKMAGWLKPQRRREIGEPREYMKPEQIKGEMTRQWTEYLTKRKPEIYEEWYMKSQEQRGLRPWAFQPRIKTVGL